MVVLARLVATELQRDRDLVERNKTEAALQASEQRFRSLVQNAFDVITILAADGTIRYESPSIERVLGYAPDELVGIDAFSMVHPDDAGAMGSRFVEGLVEPGSHTAVAFRFRHKDGSWRWLEGIGTNLLSEPSVSGIVFNSRDITERKRLAEEAARAEALAESDRLKSALLATVSHELRTPLATIKTGATSLLSAEATWTSAEQRAFLQEIDTEVDRLTLMVGNLLDLSRIEGGALRPRLAWHEVSALLDIAEQRVRQRANAHPLMIDVEPDLPPVHCDDVQIVQVLLNLLNNALRYTPPGTPITLAARQRKDSIELAVIDRGPGIPAVEINRVFEKFSRLPGDQASSGAGLGLAICKGLVEAHGGRIWMKSGVGEGTAVCFTLPLVPADENTREP